MYSGDCAVTMDKNEAKPLTLMEKFKERYRDQKVHVRQKRHSAYGMRLLMSVQAPTQLYMFHCYIIPFLCIEFDIWTQYYLKVIVSFLFVNGMANFVCVICYSTGIPKGRDRPNHPRGFKHRWSQDMPDQFVSLHSDINGTANGYGNGHANIDQNVEPGWNYCDKCQLNSPPRCHHCDTCGTCILKRDHHCYMVGTCIGFRNQRYFAVLAFYAVLCGAVAGYFQYRYIAEVYYPVSTSWKDFIPPVITYQWLFNTVENLPLYLVIMMWQMYLELLFGLFGFVYFTGQMSIIAQGKTLYEISKGIPVTCHNNINTNFRSVFGDFWALNFLFPMQIIFKQRDDGMSWVGTDLDGNSNNNAKLK